MCIDRVSCRYQILDRETNEFIADMPIETKVEAQQICRTMNALAGSRPRIGDYNTHTGESSMRYEILLFKQSTLGWTGGEYVPWGEEWEEAAPK